MNKIILTGRTTKDAELGFIGATGTPKMTFTLAVERNYQKDKNNKKVDFINMEMLGQHTEKLCQYVTKGKAILVEGELNIDQYEKDGEKRSFTKVKVDRIEFLSGNNNTENKSDKVLEFDNFQEVGNDEDIPF
jgi:single-strand DNA-binding protein